MTEPKLFSRHFFKSLFKKYYTCHNVAFVKRRKLRRKELAETLTEGRMRGMAHGV